MLLNEDFKSFYALDLKKKDILETILIEGYPEILLEVLKDPFYKFNNNYIFDYILKLFDNNGNIKNISKSEITYYTLFV